MDERPVAASAAEPVALPPASRSGVAELGPAPDDAQGLGRLEADRKLRDALQEAGYTGSAYAVFEAELAVYARQVMTVLIATELIFVRCEEDGFFLLALPIPADDREDLVQETVEKALASFKRNGLERGGWQPEKGRSLKGYFTHTLFGQFSNIWKKRVRDHHTQVELCGLSLDELPSSTRSPVADPADIYTQRDEVRRGLAGIGHERTRVALAMTELGYAQDEIAEILGVTRRAVEGYLWRYRHRRPDDGNRGGQ
jgi:DNA-directed RNA polymerase specialized sigma24 family protein